MEHRLRERCELSMDVVVHGRNGLALQGRVRDISPDGMFINIPEKVVRANRVVDVELSQNVCLHGWVVRVEDEGIGIMFHSIGSREESLLRRLLLQRCAKSRPGRVADHGCHRMKEKAGDTEKERCK